MRLKEEVARLVSLERVSCRHIMTVLGHLTATIPTVMWAQSNSSDLQRHLLGMWNKQRYGLETMVQIPQWVRQSQQWWQLRDNLIQGKLWSFPPQVVLTTDTSAWGWGAHWRARGAQCQWPQWQAQLSSNVRELLAIGEAFRF